MIPTPRQVGLPLHFETWRPNQWQAIQDGLLCSSRYAVQVQGPGAGKTATAMSQALLSKRKRIIFLTVQKGLQDQYLRDFAQLGLTDIRGKSSYPCDGLPGHQCDEGTIAKCIYAGTTLCTYNSAAFDFNEASYGITNYSCWIASHRYGKGFGKYDMMICDEAHNIPAQVASGMQIILHEREIQEGLDRDWPDSRSRDDMKAWKHWCLVSHNIANEKLQRLKSQLAQDKKPKSSLVKEFKHVLHLTRRLAEIGTCNPDKWVVDNNTSGFQFDPIDPSELVEKAVFRGIPKIILTSASMHHKVVADCGIKENDYEFFDYPSPLSGRSPIIHIPTIYVTRHSQLWELKKLVNRVDEIFESRADRKGMIHTANFKIRDAIMEQSRYSKYFVSNYSQNGDVTSQKIEQFKLMPAPTLFVSPSVKEGYDLPYDLCRYQIIAKLSFTNGAIKVERVRDEMDPERSAFHAHQSLRQAIGRGDRYEDDWQEIFIIDNAIKNLMGRYGHLASLEITACYRVSLKIPAPLELEDMTLAAKV